MQVHCKENQLNVNSYAQDFNSEFVTKRVRKDGKFWFQPKVSKKYCQQQSVTSARQPWAELNLVFCSFFNAVMYRSPTTSSSEEVKNSNKNSKSSKYSKLYNRRVDICYFQQK